MLAVLFLQVKESCHLILVGGTLTYYLSVLYVVIPNGILTWQEQVRAAMGVVMIEGVLYFVIHKAYHQVPGLYWIHRFHHQFNTIVLPSSANAVSIAEFLTAYSVPLMLSFWCVQADEISALAGSTVVAITNLSIHTPWMKKYVYHWGFVSAHDHMEHHRRLVGNYAAPVFHVDRIIHRLSSSTGDAHKKTNAIRRSS